MPNLDLDHLRSFSTVVDAGGFTRAAEELHKTQSTVSAQIKKLEDMLGHRLLERDTRKLRLTPEGEMVLEQGRQLLRLNDALLSRLTEPELEGTVRLGTPEDFATTHLPSVLAEFSRAHPRIRLEVSCELTRILTRRFREGDFDLILVKREPETPVRGIRVWREPLVWAAAARELVTGGVEVPLVVSPDPCVYRARAIASLNRASRPWRIAYQSTSLAGAQAAVRAGLGVTILPKDMVPRGFQVLGEPEHMPDLPDTEIALMTRVRRASQPVKRLAEHIVSALERT